jgi:hypothetical protein
MTINRNIKIKYPAETWTFQVQLIESDGGHFNAACQKSRVKAFEMMIQSMDSEYGFRVLMTNFTHALANSMINRVDYNCQNLEV